MGASKLSLSQLSKRSIWGLCQFTLNIQRSLEAVTRVLQMPNYKITVRITSKQLIILESCIFGVVLGSPGLDW